eukprot:44339_1
MQSPSDIVCGIGYNYYGEMGIGNNTNLKELTALNWSHNNKITDIVNGYEFTIYMNDKNELFGAGNNEYGACCQDEKSGKQILSLKRIIGLQNEKISQIYCNPNEYSWH